MLLRDIAVGIHWVNEQRFKAELEFREEEAKWNAAIEKYRQACPHPMWQHIVGSGNNDSYSICELCGFKE